jgi:hypothetical protein
MSQRTAARLAWGLWAVSALLIAGGVALIAAGWGIQTPAEDLGPTDLGFLVATVTFPTVGAVVASRRPNESIGWLFCATGLVFAADGFAPHYADYALYANPGTLPAGQWFAWATGWLDPLFFSSMLLILLLFPTGQLPSHSWRPALWLLLLVVAVVVPLAAIRPGPIFEDTLPVENPLGIERLAPASAWSDITVAIAMMVAVLASASSIIVRFLRAGGQERQQVKWLAYAASLLISSGVLVMLSDGTNTPLEAVATAAIGFAFAGVPLAAGIAILRYSLYDIDRIINRTLVYGLLTAVLALTYFGLVIGLEALLEPFTGGSDIAIALTTLVVAALFLPARRRIQDAVDRRFNRSRYDAAKTLEAFSARLRDEVDMETLQGDLIAVVNETVQPAHVSLWLRDARAGVTEGRP